jgi:predicted transcriptional regulator
MPRIGRGEDGVGRGRGRRGPGSFLLARPGRLCDNVVQETMPMTTLTIRLDPKLEKALERIAKRTGRTKSDIAREALRRQVAVARFRELRKQTLPFAEAQGLVTDEDVFRAIS